MLAVVVAALLAPGVPHGHKKHRHQKDHVADATDQRDDWDALKVNGNLALDLTRHKPQRAEGDWDALRVNADLALDLGRTQPIKTLQEECPWWCRVAVARVSKPRNPKPIAAGEVCFYSHCAACPFCHKDAACGDGVLQAGEECDDGNTVDGDGCSSSCQIARSLELEAGYVCPIPGEPCQTVCGDGIVAGKEECDDGNTVSHDGCSALCHIEV